MIGLFANSACSLVGSVALQVMLGAGQLAAQPVAAMPASPAAACPIPDPQPAAAADVDASAVIGPGWG